MSRMSVLAARAGAPYQVPPAYIARHNDLTETIAMPADSSRSSVGIRSRRSALRLLAGTAASASFGMPVWAA